MRGFVDYKQVEVTPLTCALTDLWTAPLCAHSKEMAQEAVGDTEMEILFVFNNQLMEAGIEPKPLVTHQMMLPLMIVINFFQ